MFVMILLEKYSEYITWNIDSLNVYVNFMIMLTGIVTIIVTASQFIRQQRISLFEKYTQRYQHIIEIMPEYIFEGKPLHKRDKEAVRAIRLYIDLCSEEFYLHQQKYLDKKVFPEVLLSGPLPDACLAVSVPIAAVEVEEGGGVGKGERCLDDDYFA